MVLTYSPYSKESSALVEFQPKTQSFEFGDRLRERKKVGNKIAVSRVLNSFINEEPHLH